MTIAAIRQQLMTYLAEANDQKVKALYTLLEGELESQKDFKLSDEQLAIVEERKATFSTSREWRSWQEVHASIRSTRQQSGDPRWRSTQKRKMKL